MATAQLDLSFERLRSFVGDEETAALLRLPDALRTALCRLDGRALPSSARDGACPGASKPLEMFIRRYTADTRPWIPFHCDRAAVTVNVALADDSAHGGGRLVAVADQAIVPIERVEGEATVHSSKLLHAVTCMTSGVRYALIIFCAA